LSPQHGSNLLGAVVALLVLAPAWTPRLHAQQHAVGTDVLTLDAALTTALQNNLNVQNAQLGVRKASASVGAARTQRYPSLNLDAFGLYSFTNQGYTVPAGALGDFPVIGPIPATDTTIHSIEGPYGSASVGLSEPILQQYRIGLVIEQYEVQEQMAQQGLRAREQDITKDVKQQYYEILETQSALEAAVASVAFYRELVPLVAQYVEQGVSPEYESLETQARLARAEHRVRSESNILASEKERLNNLLGRDPKTPFSVSEETPASRAGYPSMAAAESIAVAQRPEVQQKVLGLKEAQTGRSITKSEYIPTLNFVARATRLFNVGFVPSTDVSIGIQGRWDIFDWGRKSQELARHDADITQATNDIRDVKAQVTLEVDTRMRDLEESEELVKVTAVTKAAASEKLRVLTNQYKQQAALLKDVLQAESELAEANTQYQNAVLSAWTAQAQLDKALGER